MGYVMVVQIGDGTFCRVGISGAEMGFWSWVFSVGLSMAMQ
jgi:hypothetical protein